VVARIHWQALLLWRKRVPWFRKPARPAPQDLFWKGNPAVNNSPALQTPAAVPGRFRPACSWRCWNASTTVIWN
jgi:hypothetical protein